MKCYQSNRSLHFLGRDSKTWAGDMGYTGQVAARSRDGMWEGWVGVEGPTPRLSPAPPPLLPSPRYIHLLEQMLLNASFCGHNLTLQTDAIQSLVFKLGCSFPGLSLSSATLPNVPQVRGNQGSPAGAYGQDLPPRPGSPVSCSCSVLICWELPLLLCCLESRKRRYQKHPDFAWRQV